MGRNKIYNYPFKIWMEKLFMTAIFILCLITQSYASDETNIKKNLIDLYNQKATLVHKWNIYEPSSKELICVAFTLSNGTEMLLVIYEKINDRELKKISSLPLGSFPYFISENNHNLVVVCETAVGYLVQVFGYKNGVVKQLIDDGSYLLPEFVYLSDSKDAIIVPILEWVKSQNGKDEGRIPVFANVYIWNENTYDVYKKVPWNERFNLGKYVKKPKS